MVGGRHPLSKKIKGRCPLLSPLHYTTDADLLQNGVSVDVADNNGFTPLMVASQYGHAMLVAYLIGRGANVSVADKEGDTALHWAAYKGNWSKYQYHLFVAI